MEISPITTNKEDNMNTKTIWQSDNGIVACDQHLGMYATTALRQKPTRKTITTPLDRWVKMNAADLTEWMAFLADNGQHEACESCRRAK